MTYTPLAENQLKKELIKECGKDLSIPTLIDSLNCLFVKTMGAVVCDVVHNYFNLICYSNYYEKQERERERERERELRENRY